MKSTVPYYNKLSIKLRIIPWENTYLITAVTDFCRWFGSLLHGVSTLCNRRSLVLLWFVTGTSVPFCFGWNLSSTVPNINCCIKLSRTYPSKFRCGHGSDHSEFSDRIIFTLHLSNRFGLKRKGLNYKNMVNCFFFHQIRIRNMKYYWNTPIRTDPIRAHLLLSNLYDFIFYNSMR